MSIKDLTIHSVFGSYKVFFDEHLALLSPLFEETNVVFIIDEKVFDFTRRFFKKYHWKSWF